MEPARYYSTVLLSSDVISQEATRYETSRSSHEQQQSRRADTVIASYNFPTSVVQTIATGQLLLNHINKRAHTNAHDIQSPHVGTAGAACAPVHHPLPKRQPVGRAAVSRDRLPSAGHTEALAPKLKHELAPQPRLVPAAAERGGE